MKLFLSLLIFLSFTKSFSQCTPSVSVQIYDSRNDPITQPCASSAGGTFYLVATPVNGGISPAYQWFKNNVDVTSSASNNVLTQAGLTAGDVYSVTMTSNATCGLTATTASATTTISYNSIHLPVSLLANPSGPIETNAPITFTATVSNNGIMRYYYTLNVIHRPSKNYVVTMPIPINTPTFSVSFPQPLPAPPLENGDTVFATTTAPPDINPCSTVDTSNLIIMSVITPCIPSVAITTSLPSTPLPCPYKISAVYTNGGNAPLFQWQKNGVNVGSNSTDNVFPDTTVSGDVISCTMTSNAPCANPLTATNSYNVSYGLVYNTTLSANPIGPIAAGTNVTFTDSTHLRGGQGLLYYSLYVNGVYKAGTLSGLTTFTYTTNTLADGDVVYCTTQTNPCADIGTSNKLVMSVSGVLPITLSSFSVTPSNNKFSLNWLTQTETNSAYFNVQESTDGITFATIGKVLATGNAATTQQYNFSFQPESISNNPYYFRLQMVDKDGSMSYSSIQKANLTTHFNITVSPNPATSVVNVNGGGIKQIQLLSMAGKLLFTKSSALVNNPIDVSGLARGMYLLRVENVEGEIKLQKIILQ